MTRVEEIHKQLADRNALIVALDASGLTPRKIAEEVGCYVHTVRKVLWVHRQKEGQA